MPHSNFLVIGSGIAGLFFALKVSKFGAVTVLSKADSNEGSTRYAQGGIAAVQSQIDSFESHVTDTLVAGAGLCNPEVVDFVVREGPKRIKDLVSFGANFDQNRVGTTPGNMTSFELGREGGHSQRRILHVGDMTGLRLQEALAAEAHRSSNITLEPNKVAVELISRRKANGKNEVIGAYVLQEDEGAVIPYTANCTMLATGGAGKVYLYTSNPDVSTGDGLAMAARVGAPIGNMEFFQFHPTCLYHQDERSFLITEALRGEGGRLVNHNGEAFMGHYHDLADLAPRDVVARAIDDQMKSSGAKHVYLDVTCLKKDYLFQRFPTISNRLFQLGIDISSTPIPVVPAAHYCCGGVCCDKLGRTAVERLLVSGEVAFTGLHGANRLASNSLLEAVVFADRAAKFAEQLNKQSIEPIEVMDWDHVGSSVSAEKVIVSHLWEEVRLTMWNLVGIVRSERRLSLARNRVRQIKQEVRDYYWKHRLTRYLVELRNIVDVAELIVTSAALRKESRGLHFNTDYPETLDEHLASDTIISL